MKRQWIIAFSVVAVFCYWIVYEIGLHNGLAQSTAEEKGDKGYQAGLYEGRFGEFSDAVLPPLPVIRIAGKAIPVVRGSYTWTRKPEKDVDSVETVSADAVSPEEMLKQRLLQPEPVQGHSRIELDTNNQSGISSVELTLLPSDNFVDDPYFVPKQNGIYLYKVTIGWARQGQAQYFFAVDVKDGENPAQKQSASAGQTDARALLVKSQNLMFGQDIPVSIIATEVEGKEGHLVVSLTLDPGEDDFVKKVVLLRVINQLVRDYPAAERFSVWGDEGLARTYASGEYDHEATVEGWPGLDQRIAYAYRDVQGLHVLHVLSRHDMEDISFGTAKH